MPNHPHEIRTERLNTPVCVKRNGLLYLIKPDPAKPCEGMRIFAVWTFNPRTRCFVSHYNFSLS